MQASIYRHARGETTSFGSGNCGENGVPFLWNNVKASLFLLFSCFLFLPISLIRRIHQPSFTFPSSHQTLHYKIPAHVHLTVGYALFITRVCVIHRVNASVVVTYILLRSVLCKNARYCTRKKVIRDVFIGFSFSWKLKNISMVISARYDSSTLSRSQPYFFIQLYVLITFFARSFAFKFDIIPDRCEIH